MREMQGAAVVPGTGDRAGGERVQPELLVPPGGGRLLWLGRVGVRFLVGGEQTGGRFSIVEHPMQPRSLAAPVHTHRDEDEYSYVLEGEVGLQLGEEVLTAGPGTLVLKPRGMPHTFWNAAEAPARLLEIITPAGFERYFAALGALLQHGAPPAAELAALTQEFHLEMDMHSVPALVERYGVSLT
jgi:quercetin dioxygenase-like cupin family protein